MSKLNDTWKAMDKPDPMEYFFHKRFQKVHAISVLAMIAGFVLLVIGLATSPSDSTNLTFWLGMCGLFGPIFLVFAVFILYAAFLVLFWCLATLL